MGLIKPLRGHSPQLGQNVFVAETAVLIGQVEVGDESSIWYNTVLRGDVHYIRIGKYTNLQDGAIVHATYERNPTEIGDYVTVGHGAIVHGCVIQDHVLVGMGAKVLDKAVVEPDVIIAAGALVREGQRLERGHLYAGVPARQVKALSAAQIEGIRSYAEGYLHYKGWYQVGE